jgi:hypothetical protein
MSGEAAAVKTAEELEAEQQAATGAADAEAAAKAKADAEAAAGGEGGEDEGFDVVESGEATPASGKKVVPLSAHVKAKSKWKERVRNAEKDKEALASENELLRLQNEQLQERLASGQVKPRPKAADFGSTDDFEKAEREWLDERITKGVTETLRKAAPAAPARGAGGDDDEAALDAHYERSAKLKAADFDEAENEVIGAIGKDAARHIITTFPNSEAVMYALGKNPKKLEEIAGLLKRAPVKAIVALTKYADSIQLKPRKKAPDPHELDKPSSHGGSDSQKQLDRMRDEVHAGKRSHGDVIAFKKECREKGITLI